MQGRGIRGFRSLATDGEGLKRFTDRNRIQQNSEHISHCSWRIQAPFTY